ncbi:hypothetical protein [Pedobacter steynii]
MQVKKYLLTVVGLAMGLGAIAQTDVTEKEILGHISFLASPKMAGRFPGLRRTRRLLVI